jgi:hypothetical protein
MTPNIRAGKLITPPESVPAAIRRRERVQGEIDRIDRDLLSPTRAAQYPSPQEYEVWRGKARHARKLFDLERAQLETWLESNLLRKALYLLCDLEQDGVELDPDEAEVIRDLQAYLEPEEVRRAQTG